MKLPFTTTSTHEEDGHHSVDAFVVCEEPRWECAQRNSELHPLVPSYVVAGRGLLAPRIIPIANYLVTRFKCVSRRNFDVIFPILAVIKAFNWSILVVIFLSRAKIDARHKNSEYGIEPHCVEYSLYKAEFSN